MVSSHIFLRGLYLDIFSAYHLIFFYRKKFFYIFWSNSNSTLNISILVDRPHYHFNYSKKIARSVRITMTEIVPQRTNFVKLSHVFLWFSLSINYFCLALNFGFFLLIMYTLPLLLTSFELRSLFFNDFRELFIFIIY